MKHLGDIELIGGEVKNMKVEALSSDPAFVASDEGRIIYNTSTREYKFNNGTDWVAFESDAVSASTTLRSTLGTEWVNTDLSFIPTALNNLDNLSGLSSNDSLFDVITQLDAAITSSLTVTKLQGIDLNFTGGVSVRNIIYFDGNDFIPGTINDLDTVQVSVDDLTDTALTSPANNEILTYSGSDWVNKKFVMEYNDLTGLTSTFNVNHNLGKQYVGLTIIDRSTNPGKKVPDSDVTSVTYTDENNLIVVLNSNRPVTIIVTGFPLAS